MTVSMYPISVPVFIKHLNGLAGCLRKAQAYYAEKKYDEATLIHYRFYPDMFSFARQVQAMCDHAKNCTALFSGGEAPKYEDNEKTLAQLVARIEKTIAFLNTVNPRQIDGSAEKSRLQSASPRMTTASRRGTRLSSALKGRPSVGTT